MEKGKLKKKIFAASDLHEGALHSAANQTGVSGKMHAGLQWADEAWLLGDLFDPTWFLGNPNDLIPIAISKLKKWHEINPQCMKHIVWGNHEIPPEEIRQGWEFFTAKIEEEIFKAKDSWGKSYNICPKGYIHEKYNLNGVTKTILGMHGDRGSPFHEWIPQKWHKILHIPSQILAAGGLSEVIFFPIHKVFQYVTQWTKDNLGDGLSGKVTDIIFGHIHNAFDEMQYSSPELGHTVTMRNTGAAIAGRAGQFNPMCIEIFDNGCEITPSRTRLKKKNQQAEAAINKENSAVALDLERTPQHIV